jgi:hypothetical protein
MGNFASAQRISVQIPKKKRENFHNFPQIFAYVLVDKQWV